MLIDTMLLNTMLIDTMPIHADRHHADPCCLKGVRHKIFDYFFGLNNST